MKIKKILQNYKAIEIEISLKYCKNFEAFSENYKYFISFFNP